MKKKDEERSRPVKRCVGCMRVGLHNLFTVSRLESDGGVAHRLFSSYSPLSLIEAGVMSYRPYLTTCIMNVSRLDKAVRLVSAPRIAKTIRIAYVVFRRIAALCKGVEDFYSL